MTDIQDKVFRDFEPPNTSDGSYKGKKKLIDATERHLKMKLEQELAAINQRLKNSKAKVKLLITGGAVQLQATLPLKPGDTHKQGRSKKQYKISLSIPANFDGLKTAEEEAYTLGKLIARQTFTWTDKYLGVKANKDKGITFREFYDQFEKRYFETRKKTRKSEGTFSIYIKNYRRIFLCDSIINIKNLRKIIASVQSPGTRNEVVKLARIIAKILSINTNLNDLLLKCEKKQRNIPTDEEIESYINKFQERYENDISVNRKVRHKWKIYKLVYGLMAVYGLRPREVINKPDFDWFLSSENTRNTFKVHSDNKTGYREVIPFVPEWIELFDLTKQENIELFKKDISEIETSERLCYKARLISDNFSRTGIPFKPYDLRHACAIRAHLQGVPIKAAADNLGHSVEMHTKVYQNWFGFNNRIKAFSQASEERNENEELKDELSQAKKRISELELELTRLRLQLQNH